MLRLPTVTQWQQEFSEPGSIREILETSGLNALMGEASMVGPEKDDVSILLFFLNPACLSFYILPSVCCWVNMPYFFRYRRQAKIMDGVIVWYP